MDRRRAHRPHPAPLPLAIVRALPAVPGARFRALPPAFLLGCVLLGTVAVGPGHAAAQQAVDREFLVLMNEAREEAGLEPLRFHGTAQRWAESWTPRMIEDGIPSHQNLTGLIIGGIVKAGENVGVSGRGIAAILDGFMESPVHRDNILDPTFTHVGICTRSGPFDGARALWTTHVFVRVTGR